MTPIPVTLTSRGDSNFACLDVIFSENRLDVVYLNSDGRDYFVRKNGGKFLWFSAD